MKQKKFYIMFIMMVCVNGMFAQTDLESQDQDTTEVAPEPEVVQRARKPKNSSLASDNMEEAAKFIAEFHKYAKAEQSMQMPDYSKIFVPVRSKNWFSRHFDITQQAALSIAVGTDKNEDVEYMKDYANDVKGGDEDKMDHSSNLGFDVEYSRTYQFAKLEGDSLRLNRFGTAWSWGLQVSADKQENFGTTCDVLLKLGIETGKGHAIGIGGDLLLGTGTSAVTSVFFGECFGEEDFYAYDTRWCYKYGFKFWIKSNLLHTGIKNTEVKLFLQYDNSIDPTDDADFIEDGQQLGYYLWSPKSFKIGAKFCYEF